MPVYEYTHCDTLNDGDCPRGQEFEETQSIKEDALTTCPSCGRPIKRLLSRVFVSTPTGDSALKNMGFTKLVKRDSGVYENVTATGSESRYMEANKPDTMPHLNKKISD